jgi:hypothetical protein
MVVHPQKVAAMKIARRIPAPRHSLQLLIFPILLPFYIPSVQPKQVVAHKSHKRSRDATGTPGGAFPYLKKGFVLFSLSPVVSGPCPG